MKPQRTVGRGGGRGDPGPKQWGQPSTRGLVVSHMTTYGTKSSKRGPGIFQNTKEAVWGVARAWRPILPSLGDVDSTILLFSTKFLKKRTSLPSRMGAASGNQADPAHEGKCLLSCITGSCHHEKRQSPSALQHPLPTLPSHQASLASLSCSCLQ